MVEAQSGGRASHIPSNQQEAFKMRITFAVRGEYIQLDQLLKAANLVTSGGEAHVAVEEGQVKVDGRPEGRKRAKLRPGQVVRFDGQEVVLVAAAD